MLPFDIVLVRNMRGLSFHNFGYGFSSDFVSFFLQDLDNAIKEMNEKTVQGPSRGPAFKLQVS